MFNIIQPILMAVTFATTIFFGMFVSEYRYASSANELNFFGMITTADVYEFPDRPEYFAFLHSEEETEVDLYTSLWCQPLGTSNPKAREITKYNRLIGVQFGNNLPQELEEQLDNSAYVFDVSSEATEYWRARSVGQQWTKPSLNNLLPSQSGDCEVRVLGETFTKYFRLPMRERAVSNEFTYLLPETL